MHNSDTGSDDQMSADVNVASFAKESSKPAESPDTGNQQLALGEARANEAQALAAPSPAPDSQAKNEVHEAQPLRADQKEQPSSRATNDDTPGAEEQHLKPVAHRASPEGEPPEAEAGQRRPADPKSADDVLTHKVNGPEQAADAAVLAESRRHTRRAFMVGSAAAVAAYGFYHWLDYGPHENALPTLVDRGYDANAAVSRAVLRDRALAPTYPLSRAETLRINGVIGLGKELQMDSYRLQLVGVKNGERHPRYVPDVTAWAYRYNGKSDEDQGHDTKVDPKLEASTKMAPAPMQGKAEEDEEHTGRKPRGMAEAGESYSTLRPGTPGLLLVLNDFIPKLPRYELVTQFKCIEGWSQVVHWAGVRMADFLELFPPALINGREPRYVYMETPDGDYYNGYDMHVCRHPQTLLVTEMMGAPLTQNHGAPLRIHMPIKYGYKQIKRIGLIQYTNDKPDDYWTELGYDWYAGL